MTTKTYTNTTANRKARTQNSHQDNLLEDQTNRTIMETTEKNNDTITATIGKYMLKTIPSKTHQNKNSQQKQTQTQLQTGKQEHKTHIKTINLNITQ